MADAEAELLKAGCLELQNKSFFLDSNISIDMLKIPFHQHYSYRPFM